MGCVLPLEEIYGKAGQDVINHECRILINKSVLSWEEGNSVNIQELFLVFYGDTWRLWLSCHK